jgi:SSS family solute:Na+ symporter
MYTRLFCARNESVARTSTFWAALLIIPFALCITTMGMGARALYPDILPEQAFPTVMKEVLPPALNGIVLAALLCAVMSSADTCLLSASTISPQVSERRTLLLSRWGVMILGACSLILALILKGVISALLFAYTVYTCGLILPVVAGFYRKKLRVNSYGALAAIIGGGAIALAGKLSGVECLNLGGFAIGGLLLFLVSFLTRKKEPLP